MRNPDSTCREGTPRWCVNAPLLLPWPYLCEWAGTWLAAAATVLASRRLPSPPRSVFSTCTRLTPTISFHPLIICSAKSTFPSPQIVAFSSQLLQLPLMSISFNSLQAPEACQPQVTPYEASLASPAIRFSVPVVNFMLPLASNNWDPFSRGLAIHGAFLFV